MSRCIGAKCIQCGADFVQVSGAGGRPSRVCGERCRAARKAALKAGDDGRESLGPAIPLDGVSEEERARRRDARILAAAQEGVPLWALMERFGPAAMDVVQAAGMDMRKQIALAYGPPA